jgi:DNA-binding beta-propeller fold protein YncE
MKSLRIPLAPVVLAAALCAPSFAVWPALGQNPSPALLALSKAGSSLAIVDLKTGQVVARIPTGNTPHEVATDGKLAFVTNYGGQTPGNSISVIDLAARKEIHRLELPAPGRPHGMWVADGKLYFTAERSKLIGRYDPAANKVEWMLGTGQDRTHMVLVDKFTHQIFTTNTESGTVSVFEQGEVHDPFGTHTDWKITNIPAGPGVEGMDLSPDGKELWAADGRDGKVSVISPASRSVVGTVDLGNTHFNRLKFTPDGKLVLCSDIEGGYLVVVDATARKEVKRIKVGQSVEGILVAPDGAHAYVAASKDNFIAIVDLKSMTVTGRIEPGEEPDGMAWLP